MDESEVSQVVCKVMSQSESNWRMRRRPTSQGDRYPIGEVEAGFGIEVLMAGPGMGEDTSGEALGDAKALSREDLQCGIAMVCAPLYVGECLWINPLEFHRRAYCGCKTTLVGEVLHLPSELARDGGSSGMVTSNGGRWLGTAG